MDVKNPITRYLAMVLHDRPGHRDHTSKAPPSTGIDVPVTNDWVIE